jgi:choline dehydrogenase-like flavoprotein
MTTATGNTGYHIVVVGGGAAGGVVPARPSEDGTRRALLLETGSDHATRRPGCGVTLKLR